MNTAIMIIFISQYPHPTNRFGNTREMSHGSLETFPFQVQNVCTFCRRVRKYVPIHHGGSHIVPSTQSRSSRHETRWRGEGSSGARTTSGRPGLNGTDSGNDHRKLRAQMAHHAMQHGRG